MFGRQKEGRTQATRPAEKWKGCVSKNASREGPNERHSKDLRPKSKLKPSGGGGAKEETKEPRRRT
jgi:hypothetical protein